MNSTHTAKRLANCEKYPRSVETQGGGTPLPSPSAQRRLVLHVMAAGGLIAGVPTLAWAQSANIMAEGFYYRAKSLHEAGQHREALPYIARSKASLGGTNITLQYLHVMTLVGAKDYVAANAELQRFFALTDKSVPAVRFTNVVDRLTIQEQRELTRVMVDIMEKADAQGAVRAKEAKYAEAVSSLDRILAIAREFVQEGIDMEGTPNAVPIRIQTRDHTRRQGNSLSVGWGYVGFKNRPYMESFRTTADNLKQLGVLAGPGERRQVTHLFFHFMKPVKLDSTNPYNRNTVDQFSIFSTNEVTDLPALEMEVRRFNQLIGEYRAMR